jgi:hypothetical protein
MTVYVGVRLVGGPKEGERISQDQGVNVYMVEDEVNGTGKYRWDGYTVNPRKFWWVGWKKDGFLP